MNITISGKLGSGKSTLCKRLTALIGMPIHSTGSIQRAIAARMGLTTLELNERCKGDRAVDDMIDSEVTRLSRESETGILFDSRMAWHFAENSFKVYAYVAPRIGATRIFTDARGNVEHYLSVEDAEAQLAERARLERERFMAIYQVDYAAYENYDLVIDTSYESVDTLAAEIVRAYIDYQQRGRSKCPLRVSPKTVYPLYDQALTEARIASAQTRQIANETPTVCPIGEYNYLLSDPHDMLAALRNGQGLVSAQLSKPSKQPTSAPEERLSLYRSYETLGGFRYAAYPPDTRGDSLTYGE